MAAPAPWESDPTADSAAPPPQAAPAPAASGDAPWAQDQADAPQASAPAPAPQQTAVLAPDGSGFTDDQKQQIIAYIPKAKDAADLEKFSLELSGGKSKIGNAQGVLDYLKKGGDPSKLAWSQPTIDKSMAAPQQPTTLQNAKDAVGDALLDSIDNFFPGVGAFLRNHRDEGRAYVANVADAAAGDYGPEVGGFLDTLVDPSQYGDFGSNLGRNVAHERAELTGESDGHPITSTAGQLTGAALTAPIAGEVVDAAGAAKAAEAAPKVTSAAKAAAGGAVYGSGAAGPGNRVPGAVTGAAVGAATDSALPVILEVAPKAVQAGINAAGTVVNALTPDASASPEAIAAAKGAQDLNISLPKYALSDQGRAAAGAVEAKPFGFPIRQSANEMVDTSKAARDEIASGVGTPALNDETMGTNALNAAVAGVKANRAAIGDVYDQAKAAAGGNMPFWAQQTDQTLDNLIGEESQALGNSKVAGVLQDLKSNLQQKGGILTIDGARLTRTNLRSNLINDAGVTPDNATRITNKVMDAIGTDIDNGLTAAGREDAIPLYKQADQQWAQQLETENDVLKPILGKNMGNWGDEVAKKLNADFKGNGPRLARFLSALPDDEANNVRATLIQHLGSATDGNQNAAGDAFSLSRFLTNWNNIEGSRNLIFDKDTRDALSKLADVAQVAKASEKFVNRSNSGRVVASAMLSGPADAGVLGAFVSGEPKYAILGLMGSALGALRQYNAAKLLANPNFAKKLAATPMNAPAATAFWSRPWVDAMIAKNPAIAGEIRAFQGVFLKGANDNARSLPSAASGPNANQNGQDQQP